MAENSSEPIVVLMTAGNGEEAARLAEMLVGAHLAACVQILPQMESVYRWQGKVERQAEVLLIAKTTRGRFDDVTREVCALHSYEVPEIIALPVTALSAPYREWLVSSLNRQQGVEPGLAAEKAASGEVKR